MKTFMDQVRSEFTAMMKRIIEAFSPEEARALYLKYCYDSIMALLLTFSSLVVDDGIDIIIRVVDGEELGEILKDYDIEVGDEEAVMLCVMMEKIEELKKQEVSLKHYLIE